MPKRKEREEDPLEMFQAWKGYGVYKVEFENGRIRAGVAAAQGSRRRMEDAYAVVPDLDERTSFFAVYDGHGGAGAARFCAKYLHRYLVRHPEFKNGDVGKSLRDVFLQMDRLMRSESGAQELQNLEHDPPVDISDAEMSEEPDGSPGKLELSAGELGAGTTAVVLVVRNDKLYVAHAGDSFCTMWRKGEAVSLTKDHRPDVMPEEAERCVKAGAKLVEAGKFFELRDVIVPHPSGFEQKVTVAQQVTRSLGDFVFKRNMKLKQEEQLVLAVPEVLELDLNTQECEFLVLASDGLSRKHVELVCPKIHDWLSKDRTGGDDEPLHLEQSMQLASLCEDILSLSGGILDNKTAIVIQLKTVSK